MTKIKLGADSGKSTSDLANSKKLDYAIMIDVAGLLFTICECGISIKTIIDCDYVMGILTPQP